MPLSQFALHILLFLTLMYLNGVLTVPNNVCTEDRTKLRVLRDVVGDHISEEYRYLKSMISNLRYDLDIYKTRFDDFKNNTSCGTSTYPGKSFKFRNFNYFVKKF